MTPIIHDTDYSFPLTKVGHQISRLVFIDLPANYFYFTTVHIHHQIQIQIQNNQSNNDIGVEALCPFQIPGNIPGDFRLTLSAFGLFFDSCLTKQALHHSLGKQHLY